MKKLVVALTLVISTVCITLEQIVVDGPTAAWLTPIGLALPAIVMALVCFDRRLAIGHYVLPVMIATFGIYWIALGISGYAAILLEGTPQEISICRTLGSCLPGWQGSDNYIGKFLGLPLSALFVAMGFVWLLPTRRIWDCRESKLTS